MKFLKWLNLIPLVMFVIRDMLGIADINPIWMIVIVAFVIMNVFMAKSMKEYLLSSLLLLISCVAGMVLSTYYYYYFISSDFETPIVGAFIIQTEEVEEVRWFDIDKVHEGCIHRDGTFCVPTEGLETVMKYIKEREERLR